MKMLIIIRWTKKTIHHTQTKKKKRFKMKECLQTESAHAETHESDLEFTSDKQF